MPGDNPILRHWEAQRKLFRDNLFSLRDQMTVDEIHDLRVAIKKLRSYTKLHAALFNNKSNEQIPALRNLFGVLGKHRNMDIAQKLLISFSKKRKAVGEPLLVYLQLTQDQITPFCQQTVRAFTEEELDKFTNELNQDLENPYSPDVAAGVRNLIASGITVVKQDMHHFKKRSHLIRKHLKDMFYWSHLFEEQIFFTKPELKTLDKIL
ncbi:MAG TPA: CHAD domain-containing protein, partial [Chitinophagaceae bacterium]|nr:CHAD domain-containing protein [Chitinophagaceae bacterium]